MQRLKRKSLIWFFKVSMTIFLVMVLFKNNYLDLESLRLSFATPTLFIPALFLLFFGIVASGIRWWLLLKVSGIPVSFKSAIHIQLIGSFFSTYLPGASGGDIVRGVYIYRNLKKGEGRSIALMSIVTDRMFALFGLVLTAGLMSLYLAVNPENGIDASSYIDLVVKIFAWGSVLIFVSILIAFFLRLLNITSYLPPRLVNYLHLARMAIMIYQQNWPCLILCGIISVTASSTVAVGIVLIASIFPFAPAPTVTAIAGVFGNLFSAIPITPGGVGVGEVIFAKICTDLVNYSASYATIYLTFRMGMFFSNLPGGILALLWKKKVRSQKVSA